MDSGRCRTCGRAFFAGEITGLGILRTRPADRGGPIVEFPCPSCRTVIRLVPHGNGRYALPGQPPPPPPSESERTVPWLRSDEGDVPPKSPGSPEAESAKPPTPPRPTRTTPASQPPGAPPRPPAAPPPIGRPMTALEAYETLGLSPTARSADVERAFRERALLCHPDKVAHLDADFAELADRKFRRLQEARDLLATIVDRPGEPAR